MYNNAIFDILNWEILLSLHIFLHPMQIAYMLLLFLSNITQEARSFKDPPRDFATNERLLQKHSNTHSMRSLLKVIRSFSAILWMVIAYPNRRAIVFDNMVCPSFPGGLTDENMLLNQNESGVRGGVCSRELTILTSVEMKWMKWMWGIWSCTAEKSVKGHKC